MIFWYLRLRGWFHELSLVFILSQIILKCLSKLLSIGEIHLVTLSVLVHEQNCDWLIFETTGLVS